MQAHYMLGLALLEREGYGEGVKSLEKVFYIDINHITRS